MKYQYCLNLLRLKNCNNKTLIKSTSGLKVKKYIYRKDQLMGLRDSILDYINNQEIDNEDNIQEVIRKCCL